MIKKRYTLRDAVNRRELRKYAQKYFVRLKMLILLFFRLN